MPRASCAGSCGMFQQSCWYLAQAVTCRTWASHRAWIKDSPPAQHHILSGALLGSSYLSVWNCFHPNCWTISDRRSHLLVNLLIRLSFWGQSLRWHFLGDCLEGHVGLRYIHYHLSLVEVDYIFFIVVLGVHCGIYKSFCNISNISYSPLFTRLLYLPLSLFLE
jgi:hypothetical protein